MLRKKIQYTMFIKIYSLISWKLCIYFDNPNKLNDLHSTKINRSIKTDSENNILSKSWRSREQFNQKERHGEKLRG